MLIKLTKSVNFKEAHSAKHLMHLTETFPTKLLQILVSNMSPKKALACILLIELTKIMNFSRLNVTKNARLWRKSTEVLLSIKSRCEMQAAVYIVWQAFYYCCASIPVTTCHCRKALKKKKCWRVKSWLCCYSLAMSVRRCDILVLFVVQLMQSGKKWRSVRCLNAMHSAKKWWIRELVLPSIYSS